MRRPGGGRVYSQHTGRLENQTSQKPIFQGVARWKDPDCGQTARSKCDNYWQRQNLLEATCGNRIYCYEKNPATLRETGHYCSSLHPRISIDFNKRTIALALSKHTKRCSYHSGYYKIFNHGFQRLMSNRTWLCESEFSRNGFV